ncbi:MAG: bifunctional DNA-formamidopyrimidine glycosylase/DNA-(apurinic or apyrimidinic site) lyase [Firmicutes bacterium]|nr:bifunctional DNA-formamidopyrimidine glycosylase/DNA-(apurinic or apyrimidinic site) lyase [Bacillota bacterium]
MPELPEVETIRRYLAEVLPGEQIYAVPHLDPRMVKGSLMGAQDIARRLVGARFLEVERRGKFLLLPMSSGGTLLFHLGMSGRLLLVHPNDPLFKHTHVRLVLEHAELRLVDPRRFGRVAWVNQDNDGLQLGLEPLSSAFCTGTLAKLFEGRRASIKHVLLDQRCVAGLGNIYADEALFWARIHPMTAAGSLSRAEITRLVRAVKRVLRQSLIHRGTSFSDYVDALGHPGDNQQFLSVYGREGDACIRCRRGTIARQVVAGRSSHFCPVCQPQQSESGRWREE